VERLKVQALSSNPSAKKKKKKFNLILFPSKSTGRRHSFIFSENKELRGNYLKYL
jgi:hypothetical protein